MDIDSDIYILADADLTYPANEALNLLDPIFKNEADMVVGDRRSAGHYANENKRPFHGSGNFLVCSLVNLLFNSNLSDIMSGYRVFNRRFVKGYPILVEGFEIETDMTLHALDKRYRLIELPVSYKDRPSGSFSKLNTFRDGMRVLATIFNIMRYYRPLIFFGTAGIFSILLSVIAGLPVASDWIQHQYIYHVPLAILATGLSIVGFVLFAIGLILDSMVHLDKRMYEREVLNK